MKNKLAFLSLLGFLGIIGFLTENKFMFAFFAYFVFARYFFVRPDELFKQNVQKAATPAFFTGLAMQALTISVTAFTSDTRQLIIGLSLSFSVPTMLFILILVVREFRELKGR